METTTKHKFFGIERDDCFYRLRLFGMTFTYCSKKLLRDKLSLQAEELENIRRAIKRNQRQCRYGLMGIINQLRETSYQARSCYKSHHFIWNGVDRFTARDYEWFVTRQFYEWGGYFPDLDNPRTIAEKLCWLKLHYRHPDQPRIFDKYLFKQYIAEKMGEEGWTLPLLGVWERAADIDFESLPDSFVLKITQGAASAGIRFIQDKKTCNRDELKVQFDEWTREWMKAFYRKIANPRCGKTKIIAEPYLKDPDMEGDIRDYKFLCFHGVPKLFWVDLDIYHGKQTRIFYDCEGNFLPIKCKYPMYEGNAVPKNLRKMVEIARKLSAPFPHIRVDFYEVGERVYLGEMTFHTGGGYFWPTPKKWEYALGDMLDLTRCEPQYLYASPVPDAEHFEPRFLKSKTGGVGLSKRFEEEAFSRDSKNAPGRLVETSPEEKLPEYSKEI